MQLKCDEGKTLAMLLVEFEYLRKGNIIKWNALERTGKDLKKMAIHPEIGRLSLSELLASRVAHDLNHISHIARVMAKRYKEAVGPFIEFLSILK